MKIRSYEKEDWDDCLRIWHEVGWIEKGNEQEEKALDIFLKGCSSLVGELNDQVEALVCETPGELYYLDERLEMLAVATVITGRAGRKRGLATRLTAELLAQGIKKGYAVAGLGMFEQGYYDRLGFGTGPYEHWVSFDPCTLRIGNESEVPARIGPEDWKAVHESLNNRLRHHGQCILKREEITRAEMGFGKDCFGLGYYGPDGKLTHHFYCSTKDAGIGPYIVRWFSYQNPQQFLELLAVIKSLGDQVRLIKIREPRGVQFQNFLQAPFRQQTVTARTKFENVIKAEAYMQFRILDLEKCLEKTNLDTGSIDFNLDLYDPLLGYLEGNDWQGIGGEYIVQLGPESRAERGRDDSLPTLQASVGAFTRMWLGVGSATWLQATGELQGPRDLLEGLDKVLRVPYPSPDCDF